MLFNKQFANSVTLQLVYKYKLVSYFAEFSSQIICLQATKLNLYMLFNMSRTSASEITGAKPNCLYLIYADLLFSFNLHENSKMMLRFQWQQTPSDRHNHIYL